MSKRRKSKRQQRVNMLLGISLCICIATLVLAVCLLFVPHEQEQTSTPDRPSQTDTTLDTAPQTDAQFLAVLEGGTTQLDTAQTWSSNDPAIASVQADGIVTGEKAGTCQISSASTTYQVTVRQLAQTDGCTYVDGILIVNKSYGLPEDYAPGLDAQAKAAFDQLCSDAKTEGLSIYDGSDYRDYAYQVRIYQNYCDLYGWEQADTFSARPGHSEHQTGLTIDCNTIDDAFGDTQEAAWLAQHCAEYGFIIRFPEEKEEITGYKYEPWHIRYVGVSVAAEMEQYHLTLEEYLGVDSVYATPWE